MPDENRWHPVPPRDDRETRAEVSAGRLYGRAEHNGYDHRQAQSGVPGHNAHDDYWQLEYTPRTLTRTGTPSATGRAAVRGARRRRTRLRRRTPTVAMIVLVVLGVTTIGVGLRFVAGSPFAPASGVNAAPRGPSEVTPSPSPTLEPLPLASAPVTAQTVQTNGFFSWAVMDRRTGEIFGSANLSQISTTASMIKAWIASDYLRRAEENGQTPSSSRMRDLEIMIRDSDNGAAQRIYSAVGQRASIARLIQICKLTDSRSDSYGWSKTRVSARDTVRMGQCIADGRAAGPTWTTWILDTMRKVRGEGDFGIGKAFPAEEQTGISIKNGWLLRDDEDKSWHVSCMAIGDTWVMSVLQRYPPRSGYTADFTHVKKVCQDVATQLLDAAARTSAG